MAYENEKALKDISEVLKFEHWVRFYFVVERDEKLFVEIPGQYLQYIAEKLTSYRDLVDMLNNQEIDYQKSCDIVCSFLASAYDGSSFPVGTVPKVLDSKELRAEMHLFTLWTKAYEEKLDSEIIEFGTWLEMFEEWRNTDEVKKYAQKVGASAATLDHNPPSGTLH